MYKTKCYCDHCGKELTRGHDYIERTIQLKPCPICGAMPRLSTIVEKDGDILPGRLVPEGGTFNSGKTVEVVRLCTDGTKNACSFLYSRAARIAKELGYSRIITYILCDETGDSLKASGWEFCYVTKGHKWTCPSRPRTTKAPECDKQLWEKKL